MRVFTNTLDRLADKMLIGDGCWDWTGAANADGYGKFYIDGRMRPAHQVVYELIVGPVPDGLELDHLCRRPSCVRPLHLEPVTHQENIARAPRGRRGQRQLDQTHCKQGHEFTPENTYIQKNGSRHCRECHRRWSRDHRERKRAS